MKYIGIDGGLNGGLAAYDPVSGELEILPMPVVKVMQAKGNKNQYNLTAIVDWFKKFQDIKLATLEKSQAFPGQGCVSMFSIGRTFGLMEGILVGLGIPYQITHPKTWQKKMFEGISHKGRDQSKQASILVAQRLFPETRFIASEKATKLHDGLSDATLIAVFGSKLM